MRRYARHRGSHDVPGARRHFLSDTSSRGLRAPAMAAVQPGVIVMACVPYDEGVGSKTRPAIVVRTLGRTVELLPVTSSPRRAGYDVIELVDWEGAGLSRPSGVRRSPIVVDRVYDVVCVLGRLADADWRAVSQWFSVVEGHRGALV